MINYRPASRAGRIDGPGNETPETGRWFRGEKHFRFSFFQFSADPGGSPKRANIQSPLKTENGIRF
jgi:hypothetical protein